MRWFTIGCGWVIIALAIFIAWFPCILLGGWLFYGELAIYFISFAVVFSLTFSYFLTKQMVQEIDTDEYRRYEVLKSRYPRLWREVIHRHFNKPLIPFVTDAIRDAFQGKSKSAMEEFIEEAEKWEPPNSCERRSNQPSDNE